MATKQIKFKSALPYYLVGITWIIFSIFFRLYKPLDFLIITGISTIFFMISSKLIPEKIINIEVVEFDKTGNKTADNMILNGKKMLNELIDIKNSIANEKLKNDINELYNIGEEIYFYISKHPNNIKSIKKFNDYYFPETLKMLKAYAEINSIKTPSDNIEKTKSKIENSTKSVINAFQKQLDNLLYDKTFDVRTDIQVLETLLKEEGI